ncbi:flagellar protein FlgN [Paenibacillus qinlingensis]|uniref:Flagellar biosynthesis/type III secretory pathway chaperone n=1 Tax=Paenibacillus qinlingensis TaxID=1837343 RepID=A0ABU1P1J7_9BACL|nr:flagellar protein FlgN [Paenibacillus qinlingensis]MDR6553610.1 flagellar biosynthesis/type III secretory pathway chaperone [Paenibacillus qinlingensis]
MSSIQSLLETMDKLSEAHEALFELAQEKTQPLVRNDVDKLNMIVNKENKWIRLITEANQQRIQLISAYLISRGYNPNPKITVSDLTKVIFKAEEKTALIEAQRKLLEIIKRLKERNVINQQLIEQSLAFIDYTVDLVLGGPEDNMVYQHPNQQAYGTKRMGIFDTKA